MGQFKQVGKTIDDRPVFRGLPVPWVSRWTGEISSDSYVIGTDHLNNQHIIYNPETPFDRDKRNILWLRENPMANGTGEPEFATFSAYRQRACMEEGRCQVCGNHIEGPWWWIMSDQQLMLFEASSNVTENPPLCESCVSETERWCPHIKKHPHEVWKVSNTTPVAYMGEVALYKPGGELLRRNGVAMPFTAKQKLLNVFMARQLSVHIAKTDIEVIR